MSSEKDKLQTTKKRFLVLFSVFALGFMNGFQITHFTGIPDIIMEYFSVGIEFVTWTVTIFFLSCVCLLLPALVFIQATEQIN